MKPEHHHLDKHFALQRLIWCLMVLFRYRILPRRENWPTVGYCGCCGMWSWRTDESVAYSSATAQLCQECAEIERENVSAAWAEYYSGRL